MHPGIAADFGLEARVGLLELNLDMLSAQRRNAVSVKMLSEFPEVVRDIAFLANKDVSHEKIISVVSSVDPLIKEIELFDVYEGKNVGAGYKSMAYRLTYSLPDRTLTATEVDAVQSKVEKMLKEKFGAEVRK